MLLAVHVPDILSDVARISTNVAGLLLVLICSWRMSESEISRLGLFTAALFVATQIHIKLGFSSVHLLLNTVAGVILGTRVPIAIGIAVLFQAFLYEHGGRTSWGVNMLTLSIPALAAGWSFRRLAPRFPKRIATIGLVIGLFAATATVVIACAVLYFGGFASWSIIGVVALTHLPVIAIEALVTGSLAHYLSRVKPEWLGLTSVA